MKYEADLANVRNLLPDIKNVLITLSANPSVDDLAAGLALFLSFKQAGKEASIVTEGIIRVGHTNLFGVGQIQNKLPEGSGGDFSIVLGGVATVDGRIPAVEKMDYFTTGSDLNLVFRVIPGQKFEPASITPKYGGGGFHLIITVGAKTLDSLGGIYTGKQDLFANTYLLNIDDQADNGRFGKSNIVDSTVSSVSEITGEVLSTLQLPYETDIASDIIAGIFAVTSNLQAGNTTADTYGVIAEAMRRGGQKPQPTQSAPGVSDPFQAPNYSPPVGGSSFGQTQPVQPVTNQPQSQPQPQSIPVQPQQPAPQPVNTPPSANGFDLSKIFQAPVNITTTATKVTETHTDNFTVPPVVSSGIEQKVQPSPEERPMAEGVEIENPEADWLTPKIFKGKGG